MDEEDERSPRRVGAELRMRVEQVFLPDQAPRAHPSMRQIRRIVGHDVDGQSMKIPGNHLSEKGSAASGDVDRSRVDPRPKRIEDRRPMGTHQPAPSSVMVARQHHRRHARAQGRHDARMEIEKKRHGFFRSIGARVEDVSRDDQCGLLGLRGVFLEAERLDQHVEERALAGLRGVDVEVG